MQIKNMDNKRLFFLPAVLFILSGGFVSCARSQNIVSHVQAFFVEKMPGNIPVDENGKSLFKGPDTLISIYLESSTRLITWDSAFKKNKTFLINYRLIEQTPFEAGTIINTNKKIMLAPAKGHFLWQLELQPLESSPAKQSIYLKSGNSLFFTGRYKGKKIKQKVDKFIQLAAIPSV